MIFCPKTTKFGPKLAFLVNLGQAMQAYSVPVGGSVGGCGARAVSRKTPIYFITSYCHHGYGDHHSKSYYNCWLWNDSSTAGLQLGLSTSRSLTGSWRQMGSNNQFIDIRYNSLEMWTIFKSAASSLILLLCRFGEQACTALLDNFFNDGLSWHDTNLIIYSLYIRY